MGKAQPQPSQQDQPQSRLACAVCGTVTNRPFCCPKHGVTWHQTHRPDTSLSSARKYRMACGHTKLDALGARKLYFSGAASLISLAVVSGISTRSVKSYIFHGGD